MANNKTTTGASGAEGLNAPLTVDNYPSSLRGRNAQDMADGCASIAYFLREALPATLYAFQNIGLPHGDRFDRFVDGLGFVCSLLIDRMEIASGSKGTPMPLLDDLEARHG